MLLVEDEPSVSKVVGQLLDEPATSMCPSPTTRRSPGQSDKPYLVLEFLATLKHAVEKTNQQKRGASNGSASW